MGEPTGALLGWSDGDINNLSSQLAGSLSDCLHGTGETVVREKILTEKSYQSLNKGENVYARQFLFYI